MTDKAPELKPCPIALAITEHWGERCPDYEQGCPCCDAWAEYDRLTAPMTPAQAVNGDRLHTVRQMPPEICPKGVPVIVAGGIAMKKASGKWFSGMSEPAFERELNWEPEWWSNIPQGNEPLRAIAEGESNNA